MTKAIANELWEGIYGRSHFCNSTVTAQRRAGFPTRHANDSLVK